MYIWACLKVQNKCTLKTKKVKSFTPPQKIQIDGYFVEVDPKDEKLFWIKGRLSRCCVSNFWDVHILKG